MPGQWKEVVRLSFQGERFRDHALDLTALTELQHFQKLIAETAKAVWRASHPQRERLPAHFEERTRLCLRAIKDGSATTPLEVYVEDSEKPELFEREPFDDLTQAVQIAYSVFSAGEGDTELPEDLPRELVGDYAKWGESLGDDEAIELQLTEGRRSVRVTQATRERLARRAETSYEDVVDVTGEVFEANVRHLRFQISLDEGHPVTVNFTEAQETEVTTALRDHRAVRLTVRGRGEFTLNGRLTRIFQVEELMVVRSDGFQFDDSAPSIVDEIAEIAAQVPAEAWERLPKDLSENLDHYLYGTPRE